MFRAGNLCLRLSSRRHLVANAAAAADSVPIPAATTTTTTTTASFDAADSRLAPDRQRMLAQFWTLRDYAIAPDACRNTSRVVAGFNALRNQYGYSPVDLHLKLQYFCGLGLHDRVLDCLRESRQTGNLIDLPTYNMALESLAQDPSRYHHQCRSLLSQMIANGFGVDHGSFAAVLGAHLGAGDVSRAITLVAQMTQRNMFPSAGQLDRVLALCCQNKLAEEVVWLLQSAMFSPYPVGVETAMLVVKTFATSAPSKFVARGLTHLRLQTEHQLVDAIEETLKGEPEIVQLMAAYKKGKSHPLTLTLEGRAPAIPSHLQQTHGRAAPAQHKHHGSAQRQDRDRRLSGNRDRRADSRGRDRFSSDNQSRNRKSSAPWQPSSN